jgi:hypothetical protein
MYRNSGYAEIPQYGHDSHAHFWFEKRLSPTSPPGPPGAQPGPRPAPGPSPNSARPADPRARE